MRAPRRTVKELLTHAKDAAELMVDLAYAAVFFGDEDIGREVPRLEQELDDDLIELRELCMLAARTPEDAAGLAGVLALASAIEDVADAAEDIANVELHALGVPSELRDDLRHAAEVVARIRIRDDNKLSGQALRDAALPSHSGMWVIAVRRDADFLYGPDGDFVLQTGDVMFLQGPVEGVDLVREFAGGPPHELPPPVEDPKLSNLDRAVDLCVELKNSSEVAVGLAYSAILLRDRALAAQVQAIETRTDRLWRDLEGWVLRAACDDEEPERLRGLLVIAASSERIADAARSMTRLIEQEEAPHEVIAHAFSETDEIVADAIVNPGSEVDGRTLAELKLQTATGMEVLAIEHDERWTYRPRSSRRLTAGDRLLAIGPEEGPARLREMSGDERVPDEELWYEPAEDED